MQGMQEVHDNITLTWHWGIKGAYIGMVTGALTCWRSLNIPVNEQYFLVYLWPIGDKEIQNQNFW